MRKNLKFYKELYIDLKLSTHDIEKLNQPSSPKDSILKALRVHKIISMNENKGVF